MSSAGLAGRGRAGVRLPTLGGQGHQAAGGLEPCGVPGETERPGLVQPGGEKAKGGVLLLSAST